MNAERQLPNTAAVSRMCARLRTESEALLVIAIRVDDVAFSVDRNVSPRDFGETLEREIPALVDALVAQRTKGISQ
jgi:hypothetical protein